MNIGEVKYGFKLENIRFVEELSIEVYEYRHIVSGAKTVYVKNDDSNNVFAIAFKTPPIDNTGVSHILEHSVLCGSKKYPLKEPFVNLLKTSLATFLNAFTSNDWTMYPCASKTPKDFDNLVSIYLDAVFNPLSMVDKKAFLQEGWHLETFSPDDNLSIKGVVYNEMKGATSSVDDILYQSTMEIMHKDTSYRFNSGGDPLYIPDLTYEMYKDFYYKHYVPENALTFFYGDLDIESKLKMLDEEYFSSYKKQGINIKLKTQAPHISLDNEKEYPINANEKEVDNSYISLCYGLCSHHNKEELIALSILFETLLSRNNSPLKKAILDSKLGNNLYYTFDDSSTTPCLYLYLSNTNPSAKVKFKEIFENKVKEIIKEGIDKEALLATLNHDEFVDKEFDSGRDPKGLIIMLNMMECFVHDEDILDKLKFSNYYKNLKDKLNSDYFEKLLEKYILNSSHLVSLVCKPSKSLEERNKIAYFNKLKNIKKNLSEKDLEELILENKELLEYQNKVDDEDALKKMPCLSLKDIPTTIAFSEVKSLKHKDYKLHYQEINTNKISYLELYFSLKKVAYDDLPYLYLLERLFVNVSTKKYKALDLVKEIKTYLGELSFSKCVFSNGKNDAKPYFVVKASALDSNIPYMSKLIHEILYRSKFSQREMKRILTQRVEFLKQDLLESGMSNATLEAHKSLCDGSNIASRWSKGEFVYKFMKDLLDNFDHKKIVNKLNEIIENVFNKDNVDIFIGGDKKTILETKKSLKYLKLTDNKKDDILVIKNIANSDGAFVISSDVSYNVFAFNYLDFGYAFSGKMILLSQIVNLDYLWNNVRVKGGAYGSNLSIYKNGVFSLSSYRDPNVKLTYETFLKLGDYLKNYNPSKEEFESYIISAIGGFDMPLSTPAFISNWNSNFLSGVTKKLLMKNKSEILKAKVKDIREFYPLVSDSVNNYSRFTFGNIDRINEVNFKEIKSL